MNKAGTWLYPISEIRAGLLAPIEAVGFLWRHKGLLALCLSVQIAAVVGYFWATSRFVAPALEAKIAEMLSGQEQSWLYSLAQHGGTVSLYVLAFLLYAVVMLPIVNVLAGPLFDWVSALAYAEFAGEPDKKMGFTDFVRSLLFEFAKTVFFLVFLAVTLVSYWALFLAPVVFVLALWYFGWEQMDRTLGAIGYGSRRRVAFGIVHFVACISLGVWMVIPLFGSIFAFAMAPAGAITVAQLVRKQIQSP